MTKESFEEALAQLGQYLAGRHGSDLCGWNAAPGHDLVAELSGTIKYCRQVWEENSTHNGRTHTVFCNVG